MVLKPASHSTTALESRTCQHGFALSHVRVNDPRPCQTIHPRELEIHALGAMEAEVETSGAGIAPLIKARTPEAAATLRQIARWIAGDVPAALAMTDPARYRKLTRLRAEIILRGYYDYFHRLAETH